MDNNNLQNETVEKEPFIKMGDVITLEEDCPMEVVFKTLFDSKEYVILHPTDAPPEIQFVPMRVINDSLIPEKSEVICERLVNLYFQFRERNVGKDDEET